MTPSNIQDFVMSDLVPGTLIWWRNKLPSTAHTAVDFVIAVAIAPGDSDLTDSCYIMTIDSKSDIEFIDEFSYFTGDIVWPRVFKILTPGGKVFQR